MPRYRRHETNVEVERMDDKERKPVLVTVLGNSEGEICRGG
ncbi:MAG: hypothetical protein ACYC5M_15330 [Anaerolineae bacterium]